MLDNNGAMRYRVWCNTKSWFDVLSDNYIDKDDISKLDEEDAFNLRAGVWQLSYLFASGSADYSDALFFKEQLIGLKNNGTVEECVADDIIIDILNDVSDIRSSIASGNTEFLNDSFKKFLFEKVFAGGSYKTHSLTVGTHGLILKLCRNISKADSFIEYARSKKYDVACSTEAMWRGALALIDVRNICYNIELFSDDIYTLVMKLDIIYGKLDAQKILLNILCADSFAERIDNLGRLYTIMLGAMNSTKSIVHDLFPREYYGTVKLAIMCMVNKWFSSGSVGKLMHTVSSYEIVRLMSLGYNADRLSRDELFSYSAYTKGVKAKKYTVYANEADVLTECTFKFTNAMLRVCNVEKDTEVLNLIGYISKELCDGKWLGISEL